MNARRWARIKARWGKLFQGAVEFGKLRGWKYLELRGGRNFFGRGSAGHPSHFTGISLDLEADENALFGALEIPARRAVRKAEKDGVTVEILQSLEATCGLSTHCSV